MLVVGLWSTAKNKHLRLTINFSLATNHYPLTTKEVERATQI
jgi:hypothetical protein